MKIKHLINVSLTVFLGPSVHPHFLSLVTLCTYLTVHKPSRTLQVFAFLVSSCFIFQLLFSFYLLVDGLGPKGQLKSNYKLTRSSKAPSTYPNAVSRLKNNSKKNKWSQPKVTLAEGKFGKFHSPSMRFILVSSSQEQQAMLLKYSV